MVFGERDLGEFWFSIWRCFCVNFEVDEDVVVFGRKLCFYMIERIALRGLDSNITDMIHSLSLRPCDRPFT